jgi:hypothetical protein
METCHFGIFNSNFKDDLTFGRFLSGQCEFDQFSNNNQSRSNHRVCCALEKIIMSRERSFPHTFYSSMSCLVYSSSHIMQRDLLTQKCVHKKKVTDFGYPRACRFRKYQIENRSPELTRLTFSKRDFYS